MKEMNKSPKAVIFDLDGTLIDTEKIYSILWPAACKELGFEMTRDMYLYQRSLGRPYSVETMREWFGEEFDYVEARRIRKVMFDKYIEENGIQRKPGAVELLEYLRDKGIVTAIATATDIERATEYLELTGLNGYFDKVISATMVETGKPSPAVYLYACEQLGLEPSECVAVEDAPNGVRSASHAGLSVIMVPDLTEPDDELRELISAHVKTLNEIMDII